MNDTLLSNLLLADMTSRRDEERSDRLESSPSQDVGDFENVITTSCDFAKMSVDDDVFQEEEVMTPPPDVAPLSTTADVRGKIRAVPLLASIEREIYQQA